ncbi:MAG: ABC transporter permease [Chloroflexota bacterium]|nr:ABC transporter permease [Chloroflexota bacterium]
MVDARTLAKPTPIWNVRLPFQSRWWLRFRRNRGAIVGGFIVGLFIVIAILAPVIRPYDPIAQNLSIAQQPPNAQHLLGTDELGRDILSRILVGAQISLIITAGAVAVGLLVGTAIGLVSGLYGGVVDAIFMRFMDVLLAFPGILLAITIIAVTGPGTGSLVFAIGVSSIPIFARVARGSTMLVNSMEYVSAARATGVSDWGLIRRHITPNIVGPLIVQSSVRLATAILAASGLSFLGLGPQPPSPEWGAMLSTGRSYLTSAPYIAVMPGLAIMLVVFGFNLLGDGLRDAFDPHRAE